MSDEAEESRPRASRFREHTDTTNSIHPPPDALWKDIGIEQLIEQFNEENARPPLARKHSSSANTVTRGGPPYVESPRTPSRPDNFGTPSVAVVGVLTSATPTASERPFGRFQRAFANVFGSVLGKRKAGHADAEREREKERDKHVLDERKKAAEAAYHDAKENGLLPTPKVFVRPALTHSSGPAPQTPTLHRTPSKKDLHKQEKLSKRVSSLEQKLASARKELQSVLYNYAPPVPPLPSFLPPTPSLSHSDYDTTSQTEVTPVPHSPSLGKIVKKRKATTHESDAEYRPFSTDSDGDTELLSAHSASEAERTIKRVKSSASRKSLKRQSTRLHKRLSRGSMREERRDFVVTVQPDGAGVPEVPSIPQAMEGQGKRVRVGDDGFGGLGHEIF
ncbi:hypothetical protein EJ02DRAFT_339783 [Clathrospora elynae]|uniref:Uncharacterized protein n=1 Tax=Clathrospora elynae TaxID=706981 RepID=A0A6A5SXB9_9PLEO|nr:hypothetical protein EJ02DRAFT_339783 [Clathrospora elynae]